jgi:leucyl-tRNA synthetase
MLAPIAPHVCEELWEIIGGHELLALGSWPKPDESKSDIRAEENENLVRGVLDDTLNIIKATGTKQKKIYYYTAAPWKWKAYLGALEKSASTKVLQKDLIKELMKDEDLRARPAEVAKFAGQIVDDANRMPDERKQRLIHIGIFDENQSLIDAKSFLKEALRAEIHVINEEDPHRYDPKARAQLAKPYRPAIFIE